MDQLDYKILSLLKKNARMSASGISKEVHMAVSSITERIRKMEDRGLISAYTVLLNEKKLGLDVTAIIEVSLEHPKYEERFAQEIHQNPNVIECYYLAGDFDYLLKVVCASSEALERIHSSIKHIPGVTDTKTQYVLKNIKNDYTVDLGQVPDRTK